MNANLAGSTPAITENLNQIDRLNHKSPLRINDLGRDGYVAVLSGKEVFSTGKAGDGL